MTNTHTASSRSPRAASRLTRRRLHAGALGISALVSAACGQTGGGPAPASANLTAHKNAALEVWIHGESHAEWQ